MEDEHKNKIVNTSYYRKCVLEFRCVKGMGGQSLHVLAVSKTSLLAMVIYLLIVPVQGNGKKANNMRVE